MTRLAAIVSRVNGLPAWAVDAALASVAVVVMVSEQLTTTPPLGARLPAVALTTVIGGSLAFRRRAPVTSYAVGTAALAADALWLTPGGLSSLANLLGLYSVGHFATPRRALWGPLIMLTGVTAFFAGDETPVPPAVPAGVVFGWLLTWAIGYAGARGERISRGRARLGTC
jgi:hypothetical protein